MINFGWLALAGAGVCAAGASVLLKAATSLDLPLLSTRVLMFDVAALAAYGIGFLLYAYCLKFFQVGPAYVSMVAIAALLLFAYSALRGETPHVRELVGAIVILIGVFLIVGRQMS